MAFLPKFGGCELWKRRCEALEGVMTPQAYYRTNALPCFCLPMTLDIATVA